MGTTPNLALPYPDSSSNYRPGTVDIPALANAIDAFFGARTSYVPIWTATSNPSLNLGTLTGRYSIIGKMMWLQIILTIGSNTALGSGAWRFTVPAPCRPGSLLPAFVNDVSAGTRWGGVCRILNTGTSGDNMRIAVSDGSGGAGPATPHAWAAGDELIIDGTVELN